jgi:acetyl-CoA decarbonylase/synthase complex subunit gamma
MLPVIQSDSPQYPWAVGVLPTPAGNVLRVGTSIESRDRHDHWKARWGIARESYRIPPGLFAVGSPGAESPVLVSSNYKLSFDRLRSELAGRDFWILVLDTKGVNVWCSAGKGTFGTEELLSRLKSVQLDRVVSHRKLILPQLSATGVSAHQVKDRSGWRVVYGPVRAEDLLAFLDDKMQATREMRLMRFPFYHRLVLVPVELTNSIRHFLYAAVLFFALSGFVPGGYSLGALWTVGTRSVLLLLSAYLAGAAITPTLLPWIPGRAFAWKGALAGLVTPLVVLAWGGFQNWAEATSWILLSVAISGFLAMNFTGASTFTSLSGVRREMRVAVPLQIAAGAIGCVLFLVARFL